MHCTLNLVRNDWIARDDCAGSKLFSLGRSLWMFDDDGDDRALIQWGGEASKLYLGKMFNVNSRFSKCAFMLRLCWWVVQLPNGINSQMNSKWIQLKYYSTTQPFWAQPLPPIAFVQGRVFAVRNNQYCEPSYAQSVIKKMRQLLRRLRGHFTEEFVRFGMNGEVKARHADGSTTTFTFIYNSSNTRGIIAVFPSNYCQAAHAATTCMWKTILSPIRIFRYSTINSRYSGTIIHNLANTVVQSQTWFTHC